MELQTALIILSLASLAGLATLIGVGLALWLGRNDRAVSLGMGFSAGIMICMSLVDLLPEAFATGDARQVWFSLLLGVALIAVLHYLIPHVHIEEELDIGPYQSRGLINTSLLVAIGLILHDFPEGFAMANAYMASPQLGVLVAIAILVHNIPEQFAIAMPAVKTRRKGFLFATAFLAGLAEPIGASIGIFAVHMNPTLHASMMAFAAGAMVYVSLHELLPLARRFAGINWVAMGVIASLAFYALIHQFL